ncbi:MAG: amidohydrolase [Acidobacteriota bacterium]
MAREVYGCACCGGVLGEFLGSNESIRVLRSKAENGWSCNWGVDWAQLGRREFLKGSAAALGLAMAPAAAGGSGMDKEKTIIFRGGTILTVDANFSEAEALAIRGEKILAVGAEEAVQKAAGPGAEVVDLAGKTLVPGFIDAHSHVVAGSIVDSLMDYVGVARFSSADEILRHIKEKAAKTPAGEWLAFRNYDPAIQTGPAALTFSELDAASREHPVFIMNASGHLAYANRKAFAVAGIPDDVENPPGGEFVRDAEGLLTGVMKNNVTFTQVASHNPAMAKADPISGLIALLEKWNQFGLTTVSELSLGGLSQSPADVDIMVAAAKSGRLKARIRAYPFYTIGAEAWDQAGVKPGDGTAMARVTGYKLVADGSNQGFTGLQREPYLRSEDRGLAYMSREELTRTALDRARKGWQLAIHGNGDAGIDNILDTCQALQDAGVDMKKVRVRIEHCSILHDEQIARMKALQVSASFLIGHVYYWGVAMRDEVFGEEKAQLLDRCKSVEKAGVGFSLHSDFMVTDPVPLHMMEMAVTRKTWKEPDYVLAPQERISVESAIRAVTSEAAWQLFSEHEVGSLEVGKYADLVILDADPRRVKPEGIKDIAVLETWMNGSRVYSA